LKQLNFISQLLRRAAEVRSEILFVDLTIQKVQILHLKPLDLLFLGATLILQLLKRGCTVLTIKSKGSSARGVPRSSVRARSPSSAAFEAVFSLLSCSALLWRALLSAAFASAN
jgi:hypothetical protein